MPLLGPNEYLTRVTQIDLDALWASGKRALLLDLDNTLLPRGSDEVPEDIKAWVEHAKDLGYTCGIISNNFRDITPKVARLLGVPVVVKAFKPLPPAFFKAFKAFDCTRKESVVVGDQLFTDIWGARLLGMHSIMVAPLAEEQMRHIIIFHAIEKVFLLGRKPTR